MRILLFGKNGQLGWELNRILPQSGEVVSVGRAELDLEKIDDLRDLIRHTRPQCIVNAAAYAAVDRAETERESAMKINALAPGIMAEEAKKLGCLFIHYSTDYVFDGNKGTPYLEDDPVNPLNVYGLSKLQGEQAIQAVDGDYLVFRTSWVYDLRQQGSFVNKVLQWSRQQETLRIVEDQTGNPTWARALAEMTSEILMRRKGIRGLYHLAGEGYASRLQWARQILALDSHQSEQVCKETLAASTSDFPTPAVRPLFSALNCDRFAATFELRLPSWEQALQLAMHRE